MMNELTALTAFDVYGEDTAELMAELMADPEYIRMLEEDLQKQLGRKAQFFLLKNFKKGIDILTIVVYNKDGGRGASLYIHTLLL